MPTVFLRKDGAAIEEYENVTKKIGIPISIEQYYKFLVLLPLEASEMMEALKHYFGKVCRYNVKSRTHILLDASVKYP